MLAVLAAWAVIPLIILLALARGERFDGADGIFGSTDTLQYLSWIRESGTRLLISNRFDSVPSRHVFLHPMFLISGLLWRAGLSIQLAYLAWLPVALVTMFAGFTAYVRRLVVGGWRQIAVLVLALFWYTPLTPLVDWGQIPDRVTSNGFITISIETFQAGALWSALPTALSFGLLPIAFLAAADSLIKAGNARTRAIVVGSGSAALVAWLHPWQGATILLTLAALALWDLPVRRDLELVPIAIATLLPIGYYALLPGLSPAWAMAGGPNNFPHVGLWLLALTPLGILAVLGYTRPGGDPNERILRAWPVMAILLYLLLQRSFIYHALEGVTLPWAVLAVRGLDRFGARRAWVWVSVAIMTAPGTLFSGSYLGRTLADRTQYYVTTDEALAMNYLASAPGAGPVLAPFYLGKDVPFRTGRSTWVGHPTWTPDFATRQKTADQLFAGSLTAADARRLVIQSGAGYLLSGCSDKNAMADELRPILGASHRFGCATVYSVDLARAAANQGHHG